MNCFHFVLFYSVLILATESNGQWVACPFNEKCECMPYEGFLLVECMFFPDFPKFLNYSDQKIGAVTIGGTFRTVPNRAFYHLQSLTNAQILITDDKALRINLTIEDGAFETFNPSSISNVTLSGWKLTGIPTAALDGQTFNLYISSGDMENISGYSFRGFTTSILEIRQTNLITVQPNAFNGLILTGNPPDTKLSLAGNRLADISLFLQNTYFGQIVLSFNNITQIDDFAFSPNYDLVSLDLSFNPISFISSKAFANLSGLKVLNLNHTDLSSVPTQALSVARNLEHLDLSNAQISFIDVNSFFNCTSLTELILDGNPVINMVAGCFNGMQSLTKLSLNRLDNLSDVDVLITYGAVNLQLLQLNNCSSLQKIDVSDVSKLPPNLETINAQSNDISEINSDLEAWLSISHSKIVDISYNNNYACQSSIQWMAKFAICEPVQILAQFTYCNGTKELLSSYLADFNPTCE